MAEEISMDNENKRFPNGWGDNSEDDEEYGFVDDIDEDDEDSAWGNSSSPFKKNETVTSPETNDKTNAQSESVTQNTNNEANTDPVHDAPVQNVKQPESISLPAPNLNVPPNTGYVIQKQKTSPFLIIVIIVLVLVIGVLSCMFFMMNKNKKSDTSGEKSSVSEITEVQTESEIQNTTATTSVELTTKKDEPTNKDQTAIDQNKIKEAYIRKLTEFAKSEDFNAFDHASKYALYDIDNDGIEELIIQYLSVVGNAENLYYYKNGEYEIIAQCGESSFSICPEEHCVQWYGYGGYELRSILTIEKQGNSIDELHTELYPNTAYIHNNVGISKSEYEEIIAKYDAMNWINPTFYTFNTILSDDLLYAKPETTESAKSDAPTETYAFYGIVATESDSLNLRDKPSIDSNVITQLPKGTKASVYYVDGYSDWYKIYTDNGYEGYVAAQYMKEYNESSNNNDTPYASGMQTPWGTFTYSNFRESDYDSYTIYDPASVGIYLNCDIEAFNEKHSNYRIDNIYFWTVKNSINRDKPHDYTMRFILTGTVLRESISCFNPSLYLRNEETGKEEYVSFSEVRTTLYEGETFCFDSHFGQDVCDNTTYTLILK